MMKKAANRQTASGFSQIHQAKIRSRKAQIRARAMSGYYDGFCLAKHVDLKALKRPLNLSRVKIPPGHEA
jgi:hypothetical protein